VFGDSPPNVGGICSTRRFAHARPAGRLAATISAHARGCALSRPFGPHLEKHRTYGTGPKYRKIGGRVVYALDDLKAWADLGAKTSTSDPGTGTVFPAKRVAGVASSRPFRR
jgi:hypothetical protein